MRSIQSFFYFIQQGEIRVNPSCPDPGRREKNNMNFYINTSFWCLKRFYEGLKGLKEKGENKNLS